MMTTKEKCRTLRNKDFTLGEIIRITKLPKTTIYYHIKYIPLPAEVKERIKKENTKGIFINPHRKNSIWKKKLEKREILNYIINSYKTKEVLRKHAF